MSGYSDSSNHFSEHNLSSLESERLKQLYETHILDSDRKSEFDNLASLAASVCNAPIGMINFIDNDRQWSKACIGADLKEIKREDAFCNHTIQNDEFLIVEDASKDSRFKDNPYVTGEPFLRFYAGINIKSKDGYNIGSICVLDHQPKSISKKEISQLKTLAGEVELRLEVNQKNSELREKYDCIKDLKKYLDNSADLMFKIDPKTFSIIEFTSKSERIIGYDIGELDDKPLIALKPGTPFINQLNKWNKRGIEEKVSKFEFETQLVNKTGDFVWYKIRISENDGVWYAIGKNISERKKQELDLKNTNILFKNAQAIAKIGHWSLNPITEQINWSDELFNIMNKEAGSFKPDLQNYMDLVHPDDVQFVRNKVQSMFAGANIDTFKHRCKLNNGKTIHLLQKLELERNKEGELIKAFGVTQDITRLTNYENELKQSLKEKELMLAEIHHRVKNNLAIISGMIELESLNTINKKVVSSLNGLSTRIRTLGLVHENLYQHDGFSAVPFHEVFNELLKLNFKVSNEAEQINYKVETKPTHININQAVPFALSVNHILYHLIQSGKKRALVKLHEINNKIELFVSLPLKGKENPFDLLLDEDDLNYSVFQTLIKQTEASHEVIATEQNHTLRIFFRKLNKSGASEARYFSK